LNALQVENLTKSYGQKKVVDQLSFTIKKGEVFGFLGPNGAGKSTTIEIIAGLKEADSGRILFEENDLLARQQNVASKIGVQLQSTELYQELTVEETLRLFLNFHNRASSIQEYIELTNLQEVLHSKVKGLSGGQKQRLSLSLALASDPEIVILDEPTVGLDPQSRRKLWEVIVKLKEQGKTVILTTHFMDEAEELCDRIAIIDHGKLIALDRPAELLKQIPYGHTLLFQTGNPIDSQLLHSIPSGTIEIEDESIILRTNDIRSTLSSALAVLEENNVELKSMQMKNAGLEDLFLILTGKELRD